MKVTIQFDTENPADKHDLQRVMSLLESPSTPLAAVVTEPSPVSTDTTPVPPTVESPAEIAEPPTPEPVSNDTTTIPPAVQPAVQTAPPPPTPTTDLMQQLIKAYTELSKIDPTKAESLAAQCREKYGPESNEWTDANKQEAVTDFQACLVFPT